MGLSVDRNRDRLLLAIAVVGVLSLGQATSGLSNLAPADTLVLVNGDPITVAQFDQLVMEAHRDFKEGDQGVGMADQILQKRVNDYLIIQDALAAGYDEDPALLDMMEENRKQYAIQSFVKEKVDLPAFADSDSVRAYFERFYWRIQYRSLSVRTREEAGELLEQVKNGADMGALAEELSLDTKKFQGGLSSLLYWADVTVPIREQVWGLDVGELSDVFPLNDAYSFVRAEQVLPVHEEAFAKFEKKISSIIHTRARQRAWDTWIAEQEALAGVSEHLDVIAEMIADSALVTTGEFLKEQPAVAIELQSGASVAGTEMRRTISHEAMQNALAPFNHHLTAARQQLKGDLVLGYLAESQGYFEHPTVVERLEKDWEKSMIERYLNDTVAAKVRFNRDEFETFYEENKERFRGAEEVRVDLMFLEDEATAAEALRRLREGADFGYIFEQYNPGQEVSLGQGNFIKTDEMSPIFQEQLEGLKVGGYSDVMEMPMGLMIFRLDARRPGAIPPLEAVEMEIRRVIYARKFKEILDEHLAILRDGSEIQYWPERIAEYQKPVEEGR